MKLSSEICCAFHDNICNRINKTYIGNNPSPDPAQCGKPTALGTPFFYIGKKKQAERYDGRHPNHNPRPKRCSWVAGNDAVLTAIIRIISWIIAILFKAWSS